MMNYRQQPRHRGCCVLFCDHFNNPVRKLLHENVEHAWALPCDSGCSDLSCGNIYKYEANAMANHMPYLMGLPVCLCIDNIA